MQQTFEVLVFGKENTDIEYSDFIDYFKVNFYDNDCTPLDEVLKETINSVQKKRMSNLDENNKRKT